MPTEKRRYARIGSLNLLNYICLNDEDIPVNQGMGRSLNVSEGGVLLETHVPIESNHIILLSIGLKEELLEIRGKVVYCKALGTGMFNSGIEFKKPTKREKEMLKRYISAFNDNYGFTE